MKSLIFKALLAGLIALAFTACSDEKPTPTKKDPVADAAGAKAKADAQAAEASKAADQAKADAASKLEAEKAAAALAAAALLEEARLAREQAEAQAKLDAMQAPQPVEMDDPAEGKSTGGDPMGGILPTYDCDNSSNAKEGCK